MDFATSLTEPPAIPSRIGVSVSHAEGTTQDGVDGPSLFQHFHCSERLDGLMET